MRCWLALRAGASTLYRQWRPTAPASQRSNSGWWICFAVNGDWRATLGRWPQSRSWTRHRSSNTCIQNSCYFDSCSSAMDCRPSLPIRPNWHAATAGSGTASWPSTWFTTESRISIWICLRTPCCGRRGKSRRQFSRPIPRHTRSTPTNAGWRCSVTKLRCGRWAAGRSRFFKPAAGFGSRAAYRGDKVTRRVWEEIMTGAYVAQAFVPPGERVIPNEGGSSQSMKFDLRAYAYAGGVQWVAARVYQGQTTNFRQPGSGFAPVYTTVDASGRGMGEAEGEYASYVFLLDAEGEVHALPHVLYVALARGQALAPMLAGRTLRLADWYVRLQAGGEPGAVVNETYGLVRFDGEGRFNLEAAPGDTAWPTPAERRRMQELLLS